MNYLILFLSIFSLIACTNGHSESKKTFLKSHTQVKGQGKTTGHFQASIKMTGDEEGAIELTAFIQRLRNADIATAEWKLPEHVKLISGDKLHSLDFNQPERVISQILIDKSTLKPGDQIFFFVSKIKNGKKLGVSRSFVYQQEDHVKASGYQQKKKTLERPIKYYE